MERRSLGFCLTIRFKTPNLSCSYRCHCPHAIIANDRSQIASSFPIERQKNHNWVRHTFQQENQAVDQAPDDICSNMHSTHQSQEPEAEFTHIRLQIF
jgi:hypothetical protein